MDINKEYAAHQRALMSACNSVGNDERQAHLDRASLIAGRIGAFQRQLGAAAAYAWSRPLVSALRRA